MGTGVQIGLRNVVEDTTPQLGADLDVNGFSILSTANGNVAVAPDGSGSLVLVDANFQMGDGDLIQLGDVQDASIQWDGSNAVFTVSSGIFSFVGGNVDVDLELNATTLGVNVAVGANKQMNVQSDKGALASSFTNVVSIARAQATGSTSASLVGVSGRSQTFGSENYTGTIQGNTGLVEHVGTGSITNAEAVRGTVANFNGLAGTIINARCYGTRLDAEDGTFTIAVGFYASNATKDTGNIVNAYGVFLEKQTNGDTDNYSLYSLGAMAIAADSEPLTFGAADVYSIQFDGTDAVHTVGSGCFIVTGQTAFGINHPTPTHSIDMIGTVARWGSSVTAATNKQQFLLSHQYDTAGEPEGFPIFQSFANATANQVIFGGGSSSYNAATNIQFITAANVTTRTGTIQLEIEADGTISVKNDSQVLTFGTTITDMQLSSDGTNGIIDVGTALRLGNSVTNYTQINATGDVSFAGSAGLYPRRVSQNTEPANGTGATQIDVGETIMWHDADGAAVWMLYNDATLGIIKVQLT